MKLEDRKIFLLYIFYSVIFLFLTTKHVSLDQIIWDYNQRDIESYIIIAKDFPYLTENSEIINKHIAQRFFVHYIIGATSQILNIEIFLTYKIFTYLFITILIYLIYFLTNKFELNLSESILFFSLFFFNPYTIRYSLFNPAQAHDLIYFICGFYFAYGIITNNTKLYSLASLFALLTRQTAISLIAASFIKIFTLKKNKFKNLIFYTSSFLILFLILKNFGDYISKINFDFKYAYGIFFYDFSQIEKLSRFIFLPVVSFFPILIIFFAKIKDNLSKPNILIMAFACILMIGQPFAAGPESADRNIVRIATLCYPVLVSLIFYSYTFKKFCQNKLFLLLFLIGLQFWSLHPTFSITKIFSILRF